MHRTVKKLFSLINPWFIWFTIMFIYYFDKTGEGKSMIHWKDFQFYSRLGIKLKKIHCILEFNQSQWLKQYVEFSTHKTNRR